jgi:uncharacterized alpha-E superfamily protein
MYAIAGPSGMQVMPGGLARVASDAAMDVVSTQRGGGSKDIWVLPDAGDDSANTGGTRAPSARVRHDDIPSRLVENLYWFGRYTIRCEDKARLLRGTLAARADEGVWNAAVRFCRDLGIIAINADPIASLRDERNPQGITADVRRLAWCASQVRTRLSASFWRAVHDMQRRLQDSTAAREEPRATLDQLLLSLAALAGFAFDDMTQDEGWRLLRIGRRLERLQFAAGLLAEHLASEWATRPAHVEWLLEAYDSTLIYRSRYVVAPRLGPMLDLLVRDPEHPRALAFQSRAIQRDLEILSTSLGVTGEMGLEEAIPQLTDAKVSALESDCVEAAQARQAMAERLRALSWAAGQLSDRLSLRHFSHIAQNAQALST